MASHELFRQFAAKISKFVGLSWTFLLALFIVVAWITGGVLSGFTDTWLLLINTLCSITTFLVVFIIQNTQNRNTRVMQLKLDELIKAQRAARNDLLGMEEFTDQELDILQRDFHHLSQEFAERKSDLIQQRIRRHHTPPKPQN